MGWGRVGLFCCVAEKSVMLGIGKNVKNLATLLVKVQDLASPMSKLQLKI